MNTPRLTSAVALTTLLLLTAGPAQGEVRLGQMSFDHTPAEQAFRWWSIATRQNVVINWDRMEAAGYDRSTPITIELSGVSSITALRLLMIEAFDDGVIAEVRPQYVRIITKEQAGLESVIRIYAIGDLMHKAPNFKDAPEFDLSQITADSSQGGGGGIFEESDSDEEQFVTRTQRVEEIMDLIRNTIEPNIWRVNGGADASITHLRGMLVIRAPEYVHRQIGGGQPPRPAPSATAAPRVPRYGSAGYEYRTVRSYSPTRGYHTQRRVYGKSNGVSGISHSY